jgi:hypothetical protein
MFKKLITLISLSLLQAGCVRAQCSGEVRDFTLDFMSAVARDSAPEILIEKRKNIASKLRLCWKSFSRIEAPMMGDLDRSIVSVYSGENELLRTALKEDGKNSLGAIDGSRIVHLASSFGDDETIDIIAASGIEINQLNEFGQSPIFSVTNFQPHPCRMIESLIRYGVDVDQAALNGVTPLVFAIAVGNDGVANCLADLGARTDYAVEGLTLSELARKHGLSDLADKIDKSSR